MATPGRKPKPLQVHELNGNPSKKNLDKLKAAQIKPADGIPSIPEWLDNIARTEWHRMAPSLIEIKLLTRQDRVAFASYCADYSTMVKAELVLKKDGMTYKSKGQWVVRPEVKIAKDARASCLKFCTEFGLTPSSRARMAIPGKKDENADGMEEVLNAANAKARKVLK